jgi:hypothetical protein
MAIVPYTGQVSYNDISSQFGSPSNFNLQSAYNGTYGGLNGYSYIQPTNPGGANYSPNQWYGYTGQWIVTSGLIINYDGWPYVGSYPGFGTNVPNAVGGFPPYDGTLYNGTGWANTDGGYFVLDGSDDYIGSSNGPNPLNEFTVEIWVRAQGSWAIGSCAGQSTYNTDDWVTSNMWLFHPNGTLQSTSMSFYVNANPPGSFNIIAATTNTNLTAGNWYQVVGTFSNSATKIYLNGDLSGTASGGNGIINNGSNTLVIGGDPRYDFRRLTGNIAAFHMYNRELSAGEVAQNWNAIRGRFGI